MSLNRRDFIRLGSVGTAGMAASSCWPFDKELRIVIRGLCFVERRGSAVDVHILDANQLAPTVHLLPHSAVLSVKSSDVQSASAPSLGQDEWDPTSRVVYNLAGKPVLLDAGLRGAPNLDFNDDAIDEVNGTIPGGGDNNWQSLKFGVRLKTVCRMPQVTVDSSKVTSKVTLEHGHLKAMRPVQPDGSQSLGSVTKWTFSDSGGNKIVKQAMTNAFLCTVSTGNSTATFNIGAQNVVVNLPAEVWIRNLPARSAADNCADHSNACADHLAAYYVVIGATTPPTLMAERGPGGSTGIEPNYCPPGI